MNAHLHAQKCTFFGAGTGVARLVIADFVDLQKKIIRMQGVHMNLEISPGEQEKLIELLHIYLSEAKSEINRIDKPELLSWWATEESLLSGLLLKLESPVEWPDQSEEYGDR